MKKLLLAIAAWLCTACLCSTTLAQSYPNRSIKFVVPFPPGGNLDFVARSLQPKMQEVLGQPVLIATAGLETVSSTPAEFGTFIRSEIAKWGRVAKEANIRLD